MKTNYATETIGKLSSEYDVIKKRMNSKPIMPKDQFINIFLLKELHQLEDALKTWTEASKIEYKDKYKEVKRKQDDISNYIFQPV